MKELINSPEDVVAEALQRWRWPLPGSDVISCWPLLQSLASVAAE